MTKQKKLRQAVVVIHGMGEHRPLETLNGFIQAGLVAVDGKRLFYSRPDEVTKSYESRRYLAPRQPPDPTEPETYAQTEFYEYHWAHLMQGNKFTDIWPTFSRMLLRWPWAVPEGLRVVWAVVWALIILGAIFFLFGPGRELKVTGHPVEDVLQPIVGVGLWGVLVMYVVVTLFGSWVTTSFVDVVRYLDTSPRSYQVRRDIREGIIGLLQGLHDSASNYQRIIIVAHSLGSYIAYDAISYLWGQMNDRHAGRPRPGIPGGRVPDGLPELEAAAFALTDDDASRSTFRDAQRRLWLGLRANGNPWKITDLITLGSPMYFADRLYTKNRADFDERVQRRELPKCPPLTDERPKRDDSKPPVYSFSSGGRRVLYHGAPFAVVRWTNLWFPARLRFFGDWFGGPLAPLYGKGIADIALPGNGWTSRVPAWAHARYFSFGDDVRSGSVTTFLRDALGLASGSWVPVDPLEPAPPSPAATAPAASTPAARAADATPNQG
ncbi:MAG TPA: hypothetical protein VMQ65_06875 [Candidatus Limnocylindria bacterium]|nr:hypothetical protein [Candidatus Limnocylindria bacterium]